MLLLDNKQLKRYILENLSQEEIIAVFLGVSETDVHHCLKHTSNKINNPLRTDKNPSLGMMWITDNTTSLPKIRLWDFADSFYRGDCFDLVSWVTPLTSNNSHQFIQICKLIIGYSTRNIVRNIRSNKEVIVTKLPTTISIQPREWNVYDVKYWGKFGITLDTLNKEPCVPVEYAWINSKSPNYTYVAKDPCYAYYVGIDPIDKRMIWQLYFPLRKKKIKGRPRFITNNSFSLMDIQPFEKKDVLVLIKSKKDKLVIKELLPLAIKLLTDGNEASYKNISFLMGGISYDLRAVSAENPTITKHQNRILQKYYDYIFAYNDFDRAGIITSTFYRREFGYHSLTMTNGKFDTIDYGAKDISEYRERFGLTKSVKLVADAILHMIDTILDNEQINY